MKKKVRVTVVLPVIFETEIDTDWDIERQREHILDEADALFHCSTIDPIISECQGAEYLEE